MPSTAVKSIIWMCIFLKAVRSILNCLKGSSHLRRPEPVVANVSCSAHLPPGGRNGRGGASVVIERHTPHLGLNTDKQWSCSHFCKTHHLLTFSSFALIASGLHSGFGQPLFLADVYIPILIAMVILIPGMRISLSREVIFRIRLVVSYKSYSPAETFSLPGPFRIVQVLWRALSTVRVSTWHGERSKTLTPQLYSDGIGNLRPHASSSQTGSWSWSHQ